jgi:hypothetical protein
VSDVIGPSPFMFSVRSLLLPVAVADKAVDFWFQSTQDFILMPKARKLTPSTKPSDLFEDIRALIEQARAATARAINSAVTFALLAGWPAGSA